MSNTFKYICFDAIEVHSIDIQLLVMSCAKPLIPSKDGSKIFAKFTGTIPDTLASLTTKSREYTSEELIAEFPNEAFT